MHSSDDLSRATPAWLATQEWPAVSPRIRELFREGARIAMTPPESWIQAIQTATRSGPSMKVLANDPAVGEATRMFNTENVSKWATANLEWPGERVPAVISAEQFEYARDLARRGLGTQTLDSFRTGANAAWRSWMAICFHLTSDAQELHELLDLSALSIATYVDDLAETLGAQIRSELASQVAGSHAERRATLTLILEGVPIQQRRAEERLGYGLSGPHLAAVVWGGIETTTDELERVAAVMHTHASPPLVIFGSIRALWIWLPLRDFGSRSPARADTDLAPECSGRDRSTGRWCRRIPAQSSRCAGDAADVGSAQLSAAAGPVRRS